MAAVNAYMSIVGVESGAIHGPVTQKGRENTIVVHDLSYGVVSPRDPASGLPTGKRMHKPVQVTVPTGKQTPLVFNSAVTNETLRSVEIDVWLPAAGGVETVAFRIKLTNGSIAEFELSLETDADGGGLSDRYTFTFQKIELTWIAGAIDASDDWEAPVN